MAKRRHSPHPNRKTRRSSKRSQRVRRFRISRSRTRRYGAANTQEQIRNQTTTIDFYEMSGDQRVEVRGPKRDEVLEHIVSLVRQLTSNIFNITAGTTPEQIRTVLSQHYTLERLESTPENYDIAMYVIRPRASVSVSDMFNALTIAGEDS